MDQKTIRKLLEGVKDGSIDIEEALFKLRQLPFEDLGFAKIDNHRQLRTGHPEVIYCPGKTIKHIKLIIQKMLEGENDILATRADPKVFEGVKEICRDAEYFSQARIILIKRQKRPMNNHTILVVTGGTSDIPVAEEAAVTAQLLNNRVERLYDVGVAGIHRLLDNFEKLMKANVLVVIAGMEGALASVVGGLVDKPVIAVPTSVGYGANFGGLSALLCMLNSCASGVCVVNIDNGFGAGYLASMINSLSMPENDV